MSKQILFLALSLFSAVQCMDKPVEQRKLLFPFPGKTQQESLNEWWQIVREDYRAQHCFLELGSLMQLPSEIGRMIFDLWVTVRNPLFFSLPKDQLASKLLSCCIKLHCKEKPWHLPIDLEMTHDKKYYLSGAGDVLTIYDAKTKKNIRSLCGKQLVSVCKKGNLILCKDLDNFLAHRNRCCRYFFYEIETDQLRELGEWDDHPNIRDCAQCVTILDHQFLQIWGFADMDLMSYHKISSVSHVSSFVELTSDGHILFGSGDGTVVLLTIENQQLKELARYDYQGLCQSGQSDLVDYDGDDYLILSSKQSLGVKIEKGVDTIALKQVFFLSAEVWDVVGKDTVLTYKLDNATGTGRHMLSLMDYAGEMIESGEYMGSCPVVYARHMLYGDSQSLCQGKDALTITHVARNNEGYGTHFARKIIKDIKFRLWDCSLSPKKNLFAAPFITGDDYEDFFGGKRDNFGCFDLHGKNILSFSAQEVEFYPHGHALLCEKPDGTLKKISLYPKGADEHFKQLAHQPLSIPQYAALEQVCSKVEKLKKTRQKLGFVEFLG